MIELDGSLGEGGGQILRTALSLSCLLNKPFRIYSIRKGRRKPGLMPQHLMCVHALKHIAHAKVDGDSRGSLELIFEPTGVKGGDYHFDIGTAGSTSLLLQAILPPLAFAKEKSRIVVRGGTHVPFSPPFQYISDVFIPMLKKLGIFLSVEIEGYGFYPRGGGVVTVDVRPECEVKGINLLRREETIVLRGLSGVCNLPLSIAHRQRESVLRTLSSTGIQPDIAILSVPGIGQGTFITLVAESDACFSGFSALGEQGKRAEIVGEEVALKFLEYYRSGACLDPCLADQIVLYLAMAPQTSSFTTSRVTNHLITNLSIIEKFLDVRYSLTGECNLPGEVTVNIQNPS
jgi:RNA 3'-terminal phosphate cyclase (ATP)